MRSVQKMIVGGAAVVCALFVIGLGVYMKVTYSADKTLVREFSRHKEVFEKVQRMLDADIGIGTISQKDLIVVGHYIKEPSGSNRWMNDVSVSPGRLVEYRKALNETNALQVRQIVGLNSTARSGVYFDMFYGGWLAVGGLCRKGIACIPATDVVKRFTILDHIDSARVLGEGKFLVHIEEDWYIFVEQYG